VKQNVSPAVFVSIIVVVLVIAGVVMWQSWHAPSSVAAPGALNKKVVHPGGALPPEALRARDEWRKAHPESAPSGGT
jgi:hypothetical protein